MSLNFNFAQVADWKQLHSEDAEWAKTDHLIWNSIEVQMRSITAKNWKQWAQRYFAIHLIHGTPENGKLKLEDIKRRIGLCTNAPELTEAQFRKFLVENLMERGMREVRRQDDTIC
jgi:hypothetical protein